MVVKSCSNIDGDLPGHLHAKMVTNVIVDFVIGLVPFLGDLADAVYKCNTRNAIILEKYLRQRGAKALKSQKKLQEPQEPNLDASLPEEFDRYEDQEIGTVNAETPTRPKSAKTPQRNRSQGRRSSGSKKVKGHDLESGPA